MISVPPPSIASRIAIAASALAAGALLAAAILFAPLI